MTEHPASGPPIRSRWRDLLLLALLLLPGLLVSAMVHRYAVDTPFFDDFTFTEDVVKLKKGELHLGDLFTAHMEHRVILPRFIALGLHLVLGRDLRWQNVTTLLLVWGSAWNLARIFLRSTGVSLQQAAFPLFLFSVLIFCPIQWQGLLWPICFEIYIPFFSLTLAVSLWQSMRNPSAALACSILCAVAGTISFASGALTWVLMLPLLWLLREGLENRQRVRLLVAWILAAGLTIALYTHNFRNAVPSQFAYGQGNEVTVESDMSYFVHNLDKAATFALAVMGGHLSRGLNLQNLFTAQVVGAVSLVLFASCCAFLLARRRDRELIVASVPWLAIGGYSIGTAVLITIGRLWRSRSGSLAVDGRYVSHAIPLTIALVALAFIIGRRQASKMPKLRSFGWLAGGVLLMLVTTEWIYGEKVMELWQQARLQGKALLLFARVFPNHAFLGPVSGDADYGHRLITEMERLKLLREPLADSLDLPQHELRKSSADLRPRLGQFKMLQRMKDGRMMTDGFAELPDQRPADLIIFTWSPSPGVDTIFGLTTLERLPRFYGDSTYKDHEFCSIVSFGPEVTCQWSEEVSVASIPPDGAAITAWAVDIQKRRVFRIDDARALPSARLPKGVYRNSEVPRPKQP